MTKPDKDQAHPSNLNILKTLFVNLIIPLSIGTILLFIEYKSGLFQQNITSDKSHFDYHFSSIIIIVVLIIMLLFLIKSILIWLTQDKYLREDLSVILLFTLLSASMLLATSIVSHIMPWSIYNVVNCVFIDHKICNPDTRNVDYAFLLTLYIILICILRQLHTNWHGLKSFDQHRLEQRSESVNFIIEGCHEILRILNKKTSLKIYTENSLKQYVTQLEPVVDNLAWKDQAKELIRLSSTSYTFSLEDAWHDRQKCWVGRNINTDDLVCLYPVQNILHYQELRDFLLYVDRVATDENKKVGEIIIACKILSNKPIPNWNDLLIRYESEDSLLNKLVDFKDYFNEIKRRVLISHLPDSDLTLNDVYVPSSFRLQGGDKINQNIEEYLDAWLDEPGQRQIALLGEYGQGKSTATLMWAFHHLPENSSSSKRIPILIELRGTSPRNLTPLQLLGAWASQYSISPQALLRLLIAGRLALVFEGFDEMALVGDAEMRLKHFRTLWQFAYPNSKILITGRPNFFFDEEEKIAALGISKTVCDRPSCEALRLEPFDPEQIKTALRTYTSTIRNQIHSIVVTNSRFKDLVSRPCLLHIVAVLWERERLVDKIDKLTSAYVMDLFIRHSYRRQGLKEHGSPDFMALTTQEREYFMTGIAAYMVANQLPNQIGASQLNEVISNLIDSIPESISASPAISGETTTPLRLRLKDSEYGVDHVKTDVRACGLLADDPAVPGTFRFGHKSFMEYLVASLIAERIQNARSEKAMSILKVTFMSIETILLVPVAVDFLSELLVSIVDKKDSIEMSKEKVMAHRLFGAIISKSILVRSIVFNECLLHLLVSKVPAMQRFNARFILRIAPVIPVIAITMFYQLTMSSDKSTNLFALAAMCLSVLLMAVIMSGTLVKSKIQLWSHLSKKLGISDKTLHEVAGTFLIPWIREQPFDCDYMYTALVKVETDKIELGE
jgi:hypothetical protein